MMKEFLEAQGLPYKEVNVQEDVDAQKLAPRNWTNGYDQGKRSMGPRL